MTASAQSSPDYSLLDAFQAPFKRPRASLFYQLGLVFVAFVVILLPLVYLAFVGAAVWGTYYHAAHHWKPIMDWGDINGGRVFIIKLMVYVIPLFTGAVIVFFMFKPLFAGRPKRAQPLALNPSDNPLLYAFIEAICKTVGAPSPKRIDLDCAVNASASFRRGFWSMLGSDLVLTIGLPLAANLNARELAGVVAHEFGHFTQSIGMRLDYIVRRVLMWLGRVAYERDVWDLALEQWAMESEETWVTLIIWVAQIGVWFSRLILKLLFFVGVLISGFMSRQMEYHADAFEIRLAGSDAFETTIRKLATLEAAQEVVQKQIQATWNTKKQLPDNLSELLRRAHQNLPHPVLQKIDDTLGLHRTGFFDTHPSAADRIRKARRAGQPGIFHDERPATELFAAFEHPARFVTMLHYTDDLGIPITPDMLIRVKTAPSKPADPQSVTEAVESSAASDYFLGLLPMLVPMRLQEPTESADPGADAAELSRISTGLQQVAGQLTPIASQFAEVSQKWIQARAALRLLQSGVFLQPGSLGLTQVTVDASRTAESELAATRDALRHSVHEVGAALSRRLQLALSLRLADRGEYSAEAVSAEEIREQVSAVNRAADEFAKQQELKDAFAVLDEVNALKEVRGETPPMSKALAAQMELVNSLCAPHPAPSIAPQQSGAGQIRLAQRGHHISTGDIESLRQTNQQWFADCQSKLDELVRIAQTAESVAA